jgi:cytochrome c oxidase assembly factor CtaG
MIGFAGCIAFMISAFMAFARPDPIFNNLMTWATVFTLIGAVCFFASAYLLWPEMAAAEQSQVKPG